MSLFQAREWWSVGSESEDEFSPGGLAVGNVDNDSSGLGECSDVARCGRPC